jgi:hypothetical protein
MTSPNGQTTLVPIVTTNGYHTAGLQIPPGAIYATDPSSLMPHVTTTASAALPQHQRTDRLQVCVFIFRFYFLTLTNKIKRVCVDLKPNRLALINFKIIAIFTAIHCKCKFIVKKVVFNRKVLVVVYFLCYFYI